MVQNQTKFQMHMLLLLTIMVVPYHQKHDNMTSYTNLSIITKGNMINFLCANYFDAQKKIIVKK